MEWLKRCKREDNNYAERRSWFSTCKRWRVTEINIRYGRGTDTSGNTTGYPTFYESRVRRDSGDWQLISCHKTRIAATKALEYLANKGETLPRRTKLGQAKKRLKAKRIAKRGQATKREDELAPLKSLAGRAAQLDATGPDEGGATHV